MKEYEDFNKKVLEHFKSLAPSNINQSQYYYRDGCGCVASHLAKAVGGLVKSPHLDAFQLEYDRLYVYHFIRSFNSDKLKAYKHRISENLLDFLERKKVDFEIYLGNPFAGGEHLTAFYREMQRQNPQWIKEHLPIGYSWDHQTTR